MLANRITPSNVIGLGYVTNCWSDNTRCHYLTFLGESEMITFKAEQHYSKHRCPLIFFAKVAHGLASALY